LDRAGRAGPSLSAGAASEISPNPALFLPSLNPREREPVVRRTRRDPNVAAPRDVRSEARREHVFDTAKERATTLVQWTHRIMDETADWKILLEGS